MAKSLKNFISIREAVDRYPPEALRFYFASSHYRSQIDFDEENIRRATETIEGLCSTVDRIKGLAKSAPRKAEVNREVRSSLEMHEKEFHSAMEDDFNTPLAISSVIGFARDMDRLINDKTPLEDLEKVLATFAKFGAVLGIFESKEQGAEKDIVPDLVNLILEVREDLRKKGDWASADRLRQRLKRMGVHVEDSPEGASWKKSLIS
jgi:cysteinyl-tRNA synthetase